MKYRKIGKSGIEASAVAIGTWALGGWMWGGTDKNNPIDAIHAGLDAGINMIDTAPIYGFGLSEELVGKAISDRRDKVVLATKCGMRWDLEKGQHFFDSEGKKIYQYLGPESIEHEVNESLKRLGTDYIDLYQTHWQDETTPIEDTMEMLGKLKEQGKIRAIGASNVTTAHLKKYEEAGGISSAQNKFSMLDQDEGKEIAGFCQDNDIAILAYSPMELGLLTGKVTPDKEYPDDDLRSDKKLFKTENRKRVQDMLARMEPVTEKHGITFAQLALAWTVHQPGITYALAGSRTPEQAKDNAAAGGVELSENDLATIDNAISEFTPV